MLEDDEDASEFDYYVVTDRAARPDPCDELRARVSR
jgi:hypothetical protein